MLYLYEMYPCLTYSKHIGVYMITHIHTHTHISNHIHTIIIMFIAENDSRH